MRNIISTTFITRSLNPILFYFPPDMLAAGHGIIAVILTVIHSCNCANILMVTMGGTKSHKIPFWELSRGLIPRGHNITFISAFPQDFIIEGLEEITPTGLVFYVKNFTNWDLLGARMRGEEPVHPLDMMRYPYEVIRVFGFSLRKLYNLIRKWKRLQRIM